MINKELLKNIIIDTKTQIKKVKLNKRNIFFENSMPYVLVGLRRVGKSYLLYQRIYELIEQGISWESILFINFEDERLIGFDSSDFNLLLEAHYELNNNIEPILFLDEIQNINGWEKFARRMADSKHLIYITGSNAKIFSKEIASILGGRFFIKEIFPYSLKEYLKANNFSFTNEKLYSTNGKSTFLSLYNDYFYYGGLPEICNLTLKREYLNSIFQTIYLGDIALRNNIKNSEALLFLTKKLAESVRQPISITRLTNLIKSIGLKVGKQTILQYLEYMKQSYLIFDIKNINSSFESKITNPKYYFYDTGILNLFLINQNPAILENLIAIYLINNAKNKNSVFFYKDTIEIDFYIPETKQAIQVAYSISAQETLEREINALLKFNKFKKCNKLNIITYDEEKTLNINNITIDIIPAWKFITQ